VLVFNPSILYAKSISIKDKLNFYQIIDCANFVDDFNKFNECVEQQSLTSQSLGKLKNKPKREIFDILAVVNIINESVNEEFVDDQTAFKHWNSFINSNYKKKSSKQKLKKILDDSKCKDLKDYEEFIHCFSDEFRSYKIYQNSGIKTKERIEHIVFNSLILTKPDGLVVTLKKENLYGLEEFDKLYEIGDGYEFFYTLMNALGTDYFKKIKDKSDINWKKVITFIVIAIIISYMAKGLLKSSGGSSTASTGTTSSSSAASSGGSYSLSTSGAAAKGSFGTNMFRFAPKTSVLQKPWFKYTFARGGFF